MLVHRWSILRSAIPCNIEIKKVIALVNVLAKLHNFCIDKQHEASEENDKIEGTSRFETNMMEGYIALEPDADHVEVGSQIPVQLLKGSNHFHEVPRELRRNRSSETLKGKVLPRKLLHDHVLETHMVRPSTTTTRN
jgi:hypothetical protein